MNRSIFTSGIDAAWRKTVSLRRSEKDIEVRAYDESKTWRPAFKFFLNIAFNAYVLFFLVVVLLVLLFGKDIANGIHKLLKSVNPNI